MPDPRGIRNANPGNIRHSDTMWKGQSPDQPDPSFVTFTNALWGLRAIAIILLNYQRIHDLKTVRQLIGRWAPEEENDTGSYVNAVAHDLGIDPDAALDLSNLLTLARLVTAIVKHENGEQPYSNSLIANAVTLAAAA